MASKQMMKAKWSISNYSRIVGTEKLIKEKLTEILRRK